MDLVVTGGAGFIGSHLVDATGAGIIDNFTSPFKGYDKWLRANSIQFVGRDVRRPRGYKADVIFHLAASPRIQPSIIDPTYTFDVNVMGTMRILESCRVHKTKIIYASSSSVYGNTDILPTPEDAPMHIYSPYSQSKKTCEELIALYHDLYGIDYVILRFFNVYGPRQPLTGSYATVLGIFENQKANGEPLTIVGDGEQRRDFTHVYDVVEACCRAMDAPCGIYNIGTGRNYSINEIAEMVGGPVTHLPERQGEYRETLADNTKARKIMGWTPTIALEDCL